MEGMEDLRERYRAERVPQPFRVLPDMSDAGLTLGRGTLLAPLGSERDGEADERMAVLLSAATGGAATGRSPTSSSPSRACRSWRARTTPFACSWRRACSHRP